MSSTTYIARKLFNITLLWPYRLFQVALRTVLQTLYILGVFLREGVLRLCGKWKPIQPKPSEGYYTYHYHFDDSIKKPVTDHVTPNGQRQVSIERTAYARRKFVKLVHTAPRVPAAQQYHFDTPNALTTPAPHTAPTIIESPMIGKSYTEFLTSHFGRVISYTAPGYRPNSGLPSWSAGKDILSTLTQQALADKQHSGPIHLVGDCSQGSAAIAVVGEAYERGTAKDRLHVYVTHANVHWAFWALRFPIKLLVNLLTGTKHFAENSVLELSRPRQLLYYAVKGLFMLTLVPALYCLGQLAGHEDIVGNWHKIPSLRKEVEDPKFQDHNALHSRLYYGKSKLEMYCHAVWVGLVSAGMFAVGNLALQHFLQFNLAVWFSQLVGISLPTSPILLVGLAAALLVFIGQLVKHYCLPEMTLQRIQQHITQWKTRINHLKSEPLAPKNKQLYTQMLSDITQMIDSNVCSRCMVSPLIDAQCTLHQLIATKSSAACTPLLDLLATQLEAAKYNLAIFSAIRLYRLRRGETQHNANPYQRRVKSDQPSWARTHAYPQDQAQQCHPGALAEFIAQSDTGYYGPATRVRSFKKATEIAMQDGWLVVPLPFTTSNNNGHDVPRHIPAPADVISHPNDEQNPMNTELLEAVPAAVPASEADPASTRHNNTSTGMAK